MQNRLPALHADLVEAKAALWDRPGAKVEFALALVGATALLALAAAVAMRPLAAVERAAPGHVGVGLIGLAVAACAYLAMARARRDVEARLARHWLRPVLSTAGLRLEKRVRLALRAAWTASLLMAMLQFAALRGMLEAGHVTWIAASAGVALLLACRVPPREESSGAVIGTTQARIASGRALQALTVAWPFGFRAWAMVAITAGLGVPVAALVAGQGLWLGASLWMAVALLVLLALLTRPGASEAHALLSRRRLPAWRCLRPLIVAPVAVGAALLLPTGAAAVAMRAWGHAALAVALAVAWGVVVALRLACDLARATGRRPEPYVAANAMGFAVAALFPPLLVLSVPAHVLGYARYVRHQWGRVS
ncbi:hypothetical protein [Lysobacter sp. N42]|jgi:hypothetical protein|uniref:hypothetical protein n=1 Tax=Lysobacter sp. N42 TaxID=2545719 RepID=UPI0014042850|nr:hypothetical protein [Lysobacter sp. N42]